jgi:HSP20 family protein
VTADLPDMDKKEIKVNITNDSVAIKAQRSREREQQGKNFYAKERASSGYYRMVTLPQEVNPNGAKATYENGTLKIDIKKAKGAAKHEIKID